MVREAGDYFAGGGRLHATLRRIARRLSGEGIAYALLGGMALGEHGYVRMTESVDVLLTADGLARFRDGLEGGYVGTHPGAMRSFRDIKARGLDDAFGEQLDASVRQTYLELLRAVRAASPEPT